MAVAQFPIREHKTAPELDGEYRLALDELNAKWPGCGVEDLRKVVTAYDRWRTAFFNDPGNL